VPRVQNLFKALQKRNVGDEEQLIVVVEEINSASTPEPIRIPDSRRTGKHVDKAAILSMFRDLEVAKSLRFWQEEGCHVAIVGVVIDLAPSTVLCMTPSSPPTSKTLHTIVGNMQCPTNPCCSRCSDDIYAKTCR